MSTKSSDKIELPGEEGAPPKQDGLFATNHLRFKRKRDGHVEGGKMILQQLHKGVDQMTGAVFFRWIDVPVAEE